MRSRSSRRPPPRGRHRSSRRCARCSARPIRIGSASTRSSTPSGAAAACAARTALTRHIRPKASRRCDASPSAGASPRPSGLPDHVERRDGDGDAAGDGRGRREGASRVENLAADRPAPHRRSGRRRAGARARGAARAHHAGAARAPRAGAPARAPARPAPHHPPQRRAWRHADRSRLAPPQDQAAAPGRAARCVRLDEPLHRVLRALPAWRRRCLPRGRGLRVPHAARACLGLAARSRRHARRRPARR